MRIATTIVVLLSSFTGACSSPTTGPNTPGDTGAEPTDTGSPPLDTGPVDTGISCKPTCSGFECGPDGCGGSCGVCAKGFVCDGARACGLDPVSLWELRIVNGTVEEKNSAGGSWNAGGGAPDPYACVTLYGATKAVCTNAPADTFKPTWNYPIGTVTATVLRAGFEGAILDDDVTVPDSICTSGHVNVPVSHFKDGGFSFGCSFGRAYATLTAK